MAVPRGHRFPIAFDQAYPQGLVLVGEVQPDTEYLSSEDRARGKEARQNVDAATGKRVWKATVTDPDEGRAKKASFEVRFLADVIPVPASQEVLPGMRAVVLDGLEVEPKVTGQGEYKTLGYQVWATGLLDPGKVYASGGGTRAKSTGEQGAAGKEQAA